MCFLLSLLLSPLLATRPNTRAKSQHKLKLLKKKRDYTPKQLQNLENGSQENMCELSHKGVRIRWRDKYNIRLDKKE